MSQYHHWERLAGRARSAPSVVTAYDRLVAEAPNVSWESRGRYEHDLQEAKIAALVGLHREGWLPIDWRRLAGSPPPPPPQRPFWREQRAAAALASFKPTLQAKMLGQEQAHRASLEAAVLAARQQDDAEHHAALQGHQAEVSRWEWFQRVAMGVMNGDPASCQSALDQLGPFQTFRKLGSSLNAVITRSWCVEVWLIANTTEIVPATQIGYTPRGRLTEKNMSDSRYWEIYQDYVCSAALSVAREVFAILPLPYVFAHVGFPFESPQTGHPDCAPILSVAIDRPGIESLNLDRIDPSTSMQNFEHRMRFKKTTGFELVDAIDPAELGIAED